MCVKKNKYILYNLFPRFPLYNIAAPSVIYEGGVLFTTLLLTQLFMREVSSLQHCCSLSYLWWRCPLYSIADHSVIYEEVSSLQHFCSLSYLWGRCPLYNIPLTQLFVREVSSLLHCCSLSYLWGAVFYSHVKSTSINLPHYFIATGDVRPYSLC